MAININAIIPSIKCKSYFSPDPPSRGSKPKIGISISRTLRAKPVYISRRNISVVETILTNILIAVLTILFPKILLFLILRNRIFQNVQIPLGHFLLVTIVVILGFLIYFYSKGQYGHPFEVHSPSVHLTADNNLQNK